MKNPPHYTPPQTKFQKDKFSCRTYADVLTDVKKTSETAYKADRYK